MALLNKRLSFTVDHTDSVAGLPYDPDVQLPR
jgi:hypothetical protein